MALLQLELPKRINLGGVPTVQKQSRVFVTHSLAQVLLVVVGERGERQPGERIYLHGTRAKGHAARYQKRIRTFQDAFGDRPNPHLILLLFVKSSQPVP